MTSPAQNIPDVLIHVADGLLYDHVDYGHHIAERLCAAGLTVERIDLTDPHQPTPPARAHVLTGGQTSVMSGHDWMRAAVARTRELIASATRGDHTVIGICLGAQIIAESLHPRVIRSAAAIEIGLVEVERPGQPRARQFVPAFHYEQISPTLAQVPGATVAWRNDHSPVQAFSFGPRVFGCQYHPELTARELHHVIDHHHATIVEHGGHPQAAHQAVDAWAAALDPELFTRTVIDRLTGRRTSAPSSRAASMVEVSGKAAQSPHS
ncbi:type 1 glutamine amidotransferase [Cryptosporangium minutisporangium]|uniref:Glutamine amidotransferase domain-containing protein n=1 Tax=Cryptosporangium minutisporangium TaxID=113569 RepID=A0ABP6SVH3_9ACTN